MEPSAVIGLPRALLYYRHGVLWRAFFTELGLDVVASPPTDRDSMEQGAALAIDEACLSLKIYLGHVAALVGKCDYILVPRVSNFGRHRNMCTRFESTPDLVRNVFRASGQKFLSYEVRNTLRTRSGVDSNRVHIFRCRPKVLTRGTRM